MLLERRSEIFSAYETIIANLTDTAQLDRELERAQARLDEAHQEMERMARRNDESAQNQDEYNHAFDTPSARRGALKKKSSAESAAGREGRREAEAGSVHGAAAGEGVSGALRCAPLCRCDESVTVCLGEYKGAKKLPFRFRDGNSNRSGNEHLQTTRLHSREQSEPPGLDERGCTPGRMP